METFWNRPNNVIQKQKLYQSQVHKPVWLKAPGDKAIVVTFFLFVGTALSGALYGTVQLARGKKD
ncbi:hypothetical protein K493DRAFT_314284 [Basidiobolus meristosporus CBS 931.73]|uniref:Uncharacterized protein n=1 Tax=Basidiobolus meristosporus CBS 931.73 TaxID=1314790 RepID=A0A1Y1YFV3_9FUNG|nr:hypothetical protein K493DRAFT_314284 [Basidiobolus meristosporus CBS 931.73]|eukprot:ORX96920.1 hypothetical protein K493DRAFT_314284 [Basidiobolus meristosporus CBS 931.73]